MNTIKRSPNFSEEEIDMLVQLVHLHRSIFKDKKYTHESKIEKDATWATVTEIFNMDKEENTRRTSNVLKKKYGNLTKNLQSKIAQMNKESSMGVKIQSLADYEELMLSMICESSKLASDNLQVQVDDYSRPKEIDFVLNVKQDVKDSTGNNDTSQEETDIGEFDEMRNMIEQLTNQTLLEKAKIAKEESEAAKQKLVAETVFHKLRIQKLQNELEISKLETELSVMEKYSLGP